MISTKRRQRPSSDSADDRIGTISNAVRDAAGQVFGPSIAVLIALGLTRAVLYKVRIDICHIRHISRQLGSTG
jgi:hypothetical protein